MSQRAQRHRVGEPLHRAPRLRLPWHVPDPGVASHIVVTHMCKDNFAKLSWEDQFPSVRGFGWATSTTEGRTMQRVAVVTGASSGIGAATAIRLAAASPASQLRIGN